MTRDHSRTLRLIWLLTILASTGMIVTVRVIGPHLNRDRTRRKVGKHTSPEMSSLSASISPDG